MLLEDFDTAADLVAFVVDQTILQAKIVRIADHDGRWYLFYFS